jgi:hypothetical protein
VTNNSNATRRKVYRAQRLVWFAPMLVGGSTAFFLLIPGAPWSERLGLVAVFAVPYTILLLIGLRSRTIIEQHGLRLYSPLRSRYIPWQSLEKVELRQFGWPKQESIVLTVDGRDFAATVPVGGTRSRRKIAQQAVSDIQAAWRSATSYSSTE